PNTRRCPIKRPTSPLWARSMSKPFPARLASPVRKPRKPRPKERLARPRLNFRLSGLLEYKSERTSAGRFPELSRDNSGVRAGGVAFSLLCRGFPSHVRDVCQRLAVRAKNPTVSGL